MDIWYTCSYGKSVLKTSWTILKEKNLYMIDYKGF